MRYHSLLLAVLASGVFAALSGCSSTEPDEQSPPRPVTYAVLKESDPARLTRLTGSVDSWKKEMLACRVAGRVMQVVEPGVDIEGRIVNDEGEMVNPGTLLASLDTDRYILRRDEAAARVDLSKARAEQARTELERTIPERIKAATADVTRKDSEYQRQKRLLPTGATSTAAFEQSENEFKQAAATLAQAQAEQATKMAELAALTAQVAEAEQLLLQAEVDLEDCELYSPFTGQVSKVHAIAGSYLQEGLPVVTVQMMDPVKVELAVSRETDRRVHYNDQLDVFVEGFDRPIAGFVYLKDTVADAATRTFNITVLVRNRRVEVGLPEEFKGQALARTTDLYNLESQKADGKPPYFTEERTLHQDADGRSFVWKVEGLTVVDLRRNYNPVFTVKRVYVEPGAGSLPILQLYQGRELTDYGELDPENDLLTGRLSDGVQDGDHVFLSREEWMLRPGQLVQVEFKGQAVKSGFYVPRTAILRSEGRHYVFVAEDAEAGVERARRVETRVHELIGDCRRIEATEGSHLRPGTKVILDGTHYLREGDVVNAFEEVEVSL